jgi:2-oxoglutarate ferredoxin oxidoreductase subunit alpha
MDYNILIAGSAGDGLITLSKLLTKILQREGYYLLSNKNYMSRVRGGHNFIQIRFGDAPISAPKSKFDLILAFDRESLELHKKDLKTDGKIFADDSLNDMTTYSNEIIFLPLKSEGRSLKFKHILSAGFAGCVFKAFDLPHESVYNIFDEFFSDSIKADLNRKSFFLGYGIAPTLFDSINSPNQSTIMLNGNESIALGALAGGVSFYSAYPMTPSTSIMTYLSKKQSEANIVVDQAEDEIAAIESALGASYAGIRAMTGSSGGGLALMSESISFSGVAEIPIVIANVQRPGPATGLPTRTAQGDLSFVLNIGHGEFPKIIIAPTSVESCFYDTQRALNLAELFQLPVIILSDQFLADSTMTVDDFDFSRIPIERYFASNDLLRQVYKRYEITEDGVSPRIIPGLFDSLVEIADSHEHDEYGHPTEDIDMVIAQMKKRFKKLEWVREKLIEPTYIGCKNPETLLIGFGSVLSPISEAVDYLQSKYSIGALIFSDIMPLPTKKLLKYSAISKNIVDIEHNFTGQFAKYIRAETGLDVTHKLLRYDGRQLTFEEIIEFIEKEVLI